MHETPDFFDKLPFDILLFQEILRDDVFTQKICFDKKKERQERGECVWQRRRVGIQRLGKLKTFHVVSTSTEC